MHYTNTPKQLRTLHLTATMTTFMDIAHLIQVPPILFTTMTNSNVIDPAKIFFLFDDNSFAATQANIDQN